MSRGGALEQAALLAGRLTAEAAVVAILAGFLVALFGRWLPPRARYAVWLLVPLRLLLPVSCGFRWSIFRVAPKLELRPGPETTVELVPAHFSVLPEELRVTPIPASPLDLTVRVVIVLWIIGMILFSAWLLFQYLSIRRRVRRATRVEDPVALAILNEAKERTRVTRDCRLLALKGLNSPALFARSSILVPAGGAADSEFKYGLMHELVHLKRRDHWINFLLGLLQVVHWFNPFVWWAFRRLRTQLEICCDEKALELLGRNHRHDYCQALVRLAVAEPATSPLLGFSLLAAQSELKERIQSIARPAVSRSQLALGQIFVLVFAVPVLCDPVRHNIPEMRVEGLVLDDSTGEPIRDITLSTTHMMPQPSGWIAEIGLPHPQKGRRPGTFRFRIEYPEAYTRSALHLEAAGYEPFDSITFRGRIPQHVTVQMHRRQ